MEGPYCGSCAEKNVKKYKRWAKKSSRGFNEVCQDKECVGLTIIKKPYRSQWVIKEVKDKPSGYHRKEIGWCFWDDDSTRSY